MEDAKGFAQRHSKDRSTKVGALILGGDNSPLSWGYNGFPRGINDDSEERHQRPLKYSYSVHAEANAVYNAARSGIKLAGGKIYVSEMIPCNNCTMAIIQAGIKEVYLEEKAFDESNPRVKAWIEQWEVSKTMLLEAGVQIKVLPKEVLYDCRITPPSSLPTPKLIC